MKKITLNVLKTIGTLYVLDAADPWQQTAREKFVREFIEFVALHI